MKKIAKIAKVISIVCYLSVIFVGMMSAMPFACLLLFSLFVLSEPEWPFSVLALIGLIINYKTFSSERTLRILVLDMVAFVLMAAFLVWKLLVLPIELLNYLGFVIPVSGFVFFYFASLGFSTKQYCSTVLHPLSN